MFVKIEKIGLIMHRPPAFVIARKQMLQSVLDLFRDMSQMHVVTRARGTFDLERITVEHVEP